MTTLVEVHPEPSPKISSITVRIPIDEVFALRAVLANISGQPDCTRRNLIDNIRACLDDATRDEKQPSRAYCSGTIHFTSRIR